MPGRNLRTILVVLGVVFAQSVRAQEHNISVVVKANITTSSRLFPYPNSTDVLQRSQYFAVEDFLGYGVEIRYRFPETNVALGLSSDYIRTSINQSVLSGSTFVPLEDGYRVVPVELTGYFLIPVSGPTFGVFMGGGIGGYFGKRLYKLAQTEAPTVNQGRGFGIHVLGGVSYRFADWFSLDAEMKFRDLQFQTSNQFSTPELIYRGAVVSLPQAPFDSSVHTDGVVFQLGTVFNF